MVAQSGTTHIHWQLASTTYERLETALVAGCSAVVAATVVAEVASGCDWEWVWWRWERRTSQCQGGRGGCPWWEGERCVRGDRCVCGGGTDVPAISATRPRETFGGDLGGVDDNECDEVVDVLIPPQWPLAKVLTTLD